MVPSELMRKVVDVLESQQIRYFVTGSMATITYGDPRFTNDIDVVVELDSEQIDSFCSAFSPPEFYWSRDAAFLAVRERFQFNVIHTKSGLKVDVIIPEDSDFARSCFDRRTRILASDGKEAWFAAPEDIILKKMVYFQEGKSDKHIRDIIGVLKVQGSKVDRAYIQSWAEKLQLVDTWQEILSRADNS